MASVMGHVRDGAAPRVRETPTAARSRAEWVHAGQHEGETMVGRLAVIHLLTVERSPLTLRRALSAARAAGVEHDRRGDGADPLATGIERGGGGATSGRHRARAGEEPLAAGIERGGRGAHGGRSRMPGSEGGIVGVVRFFFRARRRGKFCGARPFSEQIGAPRLGIAEGHAQVCESQALYWGPIPSANTETIQTAELGDMNTNS